MRHSRATRIGAIGEPSKAVLDLGRAPLLERRMPTGRYQALRSCDRPRVQGAIGEIFAEPAAFIGDHQHVVGRRLLGESRDLLLDLLVSAVGSAANVVTELALLDDLQAEPIGGAPQRVRESLIVGLGASTRNQRCQRFQRRYCASPSASMERDGAV